MFPSSQHLCITHSQGKHQNTQPYKQAWEGGKLSSDCPIIHWFLFPYKLAQDKKQWQCYLLVLAQSHSQRNQTRFKRPKLAFRSFLLQYSQHPSLQRQRERGLGAGKVLENRPILSPSKGKLPMTSTAQHSICHSTHLLNQWVKKRKERKEKGREEGREEERKEEGKKCISFSSFPFWAHCSWNNQTHLEVEITIWVWERPKGCHMPITTFPPIWTSRP